MNKTKLTLAIGVLGISGVAYPYGFAPQTVTTAVSQDTTKEAQMVAKESTLTAQEFHRSIMDMAGAVNNGAMVENIQRNQTATAIIKADDDTRRMKLNYEHAQKTADKIHKIQQDYGPLTGQGYRTCRIISENQSTKKLQDESRHMADSIAQTGDNVAGRMVSSLSNAIQARQENHLTNFCGENDVDNKQCKSVSTHANADTNSSVLFEPATVGTKTDKAKDAVRQNLLGNPHAKINPNVGKTALGQAYLYQTNQHTALKAFPSYVLAYLQSMSTVRDDIKDANGVAMSANEKAYATSARYFGSSESKEWLKSLQVQRFRGLLVEYSNLQDINLWQIHEMKNLVDLEIGTKSAGLLALTNAQDKNLTKQHNRLAREKVAGNVGVD